MHSHQNLCGPAIMDHNLDLWAESYYTPRDHNVHDPEGSTDIQYDVRRPPLSAGLARIADVVHPPVPTNVFRAVSYSDPSFADNTPYLSPNHMSVGQRQLANGQLQINTRLTSCQINDPESSTASTSSFPHVLQTPYFQFHPGLQPSVHTSPQSAPAENRLLMPELEKMSPFPSSPLSHYSSNVEEDAHDDPISPLPMETDIVTQVQMPHILEWKRVIEQCGTNDFVPQTVYQPYTEADRKRYIRDVKLQETIFFRLEDSSELGISLDDALKQRLRFLKDKNDTMFVGCGPSVSIRIQWPGYAPWSRQIPTMDFKTPKGHITRAKLAKNIAACIQRFAEAVQDKPMEPESDRRWKVGKRHITAEDLILVSLHHVSKGSWQPHIRLRGPIPLFSYTS